MLKKGFGEEHFLKKGRFKSKLKKGFKKALVIKEPFFLANFKNYPANLFTCNRCKPFNLE